MSAGVAQVMTGVAFRTSIATVFVAIVKFAASVGVKVTDSVCAAPAFRIVPASGLSTNVPGTLAVAFSCVALSAVPYVMSAGTVQLIVVLAFSTVIVVVFVTVV